VASADLKGALQDANQVDLTVTGRRSGRDSTRPVWFVQEGDRILLMPVGGSGANWYRNIVKTPSIRLSAQGAELRTDGRPIEDAAAVADALEKFGAKYGADRVDQYYPDQDAVVEVSLS
jgi:hypothetical protein